MILSTQLSWDQQSDKNLSNSTDARAHSNELRIKVVIIIMVEMAMRVIKDAFQWAPIIFVLFLLQVEALLVSSCKELMDAWALTNKNLSERTLETERAKKQSMHYGLRRPMGFKMCEKLSKVDVWFSLILTPTTKKMVPLSLKWPKFCIIFLGHIFATKKLKKLRQTAGKVWR